MKLYGKKVIDVVIIFIIAAIGIYGFILEFNSASNQEKIEEKGSEKARISVDKAFETLAKKDIIDAETEVNRLDVEKRKAFESEIIILQMYNNKITETGKLIDVAEKSKNEEDIKAAQQSIDRNTRENNENQKRLNEIKH